MVTEQLIIKCIDNDRRAQKTVYELYCRLLMGICIRYSKDKEEAEDLLQDSFIKIFKNIQSFAGKGSFKSWACRICVNTCIENFRKRKNTLLVVDYEDNYSLHEEEKVFSNFSKVEILNQIQALPDGYRMIFNLHEIEGFKHSEIAEKLNISAGTSKSQLCRAKKILKEKLIKTGYKDFIVNE